MIQVPPTNSRDNNRVCDAISSAVGNNYDIVVAPEYAFANPNHSDSLTSVEKEKYLSQLVAASQSKNTLIVDTT